MSRITKIIAALSISLLSIFAPATQVNAATSSANNFYFSEFYADYYLYKDNSGNSKMFVVEELTAVFPLFSQNHGITRVIPFTNNNGKNLTMKSDDTLYIDVERNGNEEPIDHIEINDGYFTVYIGDADKYVTGEQVYTLVYEFENLIMDFDDWQELYWDANGNDWSQRFEKVTARVHLDESIANGFTGETSCYVGRYGATGTNRCTTTKFTENVNLENGLKSTGGVEFTASSLSSRETLTFDLQFKANTFNKPKLTYDYRLVIISIIGLALGVGMIILTVICWKNAVAKRKYYQGLFVKPEYTPAKDITVAEMATNYVGKGARGDAKVATLLDMAVNHQIEMIKTEQDGMFGKKKTVWKIKIKAAKLNSEQVTVLKILAGGYAPLNVDQVITIQSRTANSELISLAQSFPTKVSKALVKKGFEVKKDDKKNRNYSNILAIALAAWLFAWILVIVFTSEVPPYIHLAGGTEFDDFGILHVFCTVWAIAIFITATIVSIKTSKFYTHTEKGLEYSRYMEGLQLYIKMAEADRLKMLQSVEGADTTHEGIVKLYEKLLPYAVIFKLEKSWLDELGRYYEFNDVSTPTWYVGVGAFSAAEFSSAMAAASSSISSSITHSSTSNSSSGGSGGFGGGFAGGGGGGGGGGGW